MFISLSIVFLRIWKSYTKHSAWTRHDNHILSYSYTFDHVSTEIRGRANGVWHSFYCYQNRSLSIQKPSPIEWKRKSFFLRCVVDDWLTSFGRYVFSIHGRLELCGELIRMVHNFHNYCLWRLHSPRLLCREGRSWRDSRLSGSFVRSYFLFPVYHGSYSRFLYCGLPCWLGGECKEFQWSVYRIPQKFSFACA